MLRLRLVAGPLDTVVAEVTAAVLATVVLWNALDADPLLATLADGHGGGCKALVGGVIHMEGFACRALDKGVSWLLWDDVERDLDLERDSRTSRNRNVEYHDSD